jgi:hypothetical protein
MPLSPNAPGYTDTEKRLLQELLDEVRRFIAAAGWEQQLPFTASRAYVLERLGNSVELTLRLYHYVSKTQHPEEIKLRLDVSIQGTGKEKWTSANGGFFLDHGSTAQVAATIRAFQADIRPVQEQLANDYRSTFHNY